MPQQHRFRNGRLKLALTYVVLISVAAFVVYYVALRRPAEREGDYPVKLTAQYVYSATGGDDPGNIICQDVMRRNPRVLIKDWSPLRIEGSASRGNAQLLLAFAGQTGPDIYYNHFHEMRKNVSQGFCTPLNEYIGEDTNGDGRIDDEEAKWDYWKEIPEITRFCATVDGKVYGIPWSTPIYHGIVYRRDLLRKAGLPDEPPKDWDAFWYYCQKLTDVGREIPGARFARGQRGFALPFSGWQWLQWLWAAGGEALMQGKTNPQTGKTHWFKEEEMRFLDPETGESLAGQPSEWKATLTTEASLRAIRFYRKLCWQRWIRNPGTGEPIDITAAQAEAGSAVDPRTGETVEFTRDDVIVGVVRRALGDEVSWPEMFRLGEVAMVMSDVRELKQYNVAPQNLGFFAVPGADENHHSVVGFFNHYLSLGPELAGPQMKEARDVAWEIISRFAGPEGQLMRVRRKAEEGYARFMTPPELEKAGLEEYIDQIPQHWRENFDKVIENYHVEPFMGYWWPISQQMQRKVLEMVGKDEGFDIEDAVEHVQDAANKGVMFGLPEEVLAAHRPIAWAGVGVGGLCFLAAMVVIIRYYMPQEGVPMASARGVHRRLLPWIMLVPAILLIVLWSYYPLIRGAVIAFQDYRIVGESSWVGVDNFINVFLKKDFYLWCEKTVKYAVLALGLTFFTPIFLAVLLSEVPRWKTFWRTIFFLPQVSSGLVILFIWKLLYNPTEYGLLNQILLGMNGLPLWVSVAIKVVFWLALAGAGLLLTKIGFQRDHDTTSQGVLLTGLAFFVLSALIAAVAAAFWPELGPKDDPVAFPRMAVTFDVFGVLLLAKLFFVFDKNEMKQVLWLCGGAFAVLLAYRVYTGTEWIVRNPLGGLAGQIGLLVVTPAVVYALTRYWQGDEALMDTAYSRALGGIVALALATWLTQALVRHGLHASAWEALAAAAKWTTQGFAFEKQDWLGSAKWAMIAVILPGMWQGAGMGSLIYLAALKSVDDESYEAAEIDGAGLWHKIWYVTIPYLKPLIIINFIGAFIGTFQTMQNIFAMTGGGPGEETMVLSLAIWIHAFSYLKFGIATSMAWVMGIALIFFTLYQLRILRKVEFRRADSF